jgi:hypothetical protein
MASHFTRGTPILKFLDPRMEILDYTMNSALIWLKQELKLPQANNKMIKMSTWK